MYQYFDIPAMQRSADNITEVMKRGDFYRCGIEIYVGGFPDVSGPDLVISPNDEKGIEIFKRFASEMAAHYKTLIQ